jgi:hypothetical protein
MLEVIATMSVASACPGSGGSTSGLAWKNNALMHMAGAEIMECFPETRKGYIGYYRWHGTIFGVRVGWLDLIAVHFCASAGATSISVGGLRLASQRHPFKIASVLLKLLHIAHDSTGAALRFLLFILARWVCLISGSAAASWKHGISSLFEAGRKAYKGRMAAHWH